MPKLIAQMIARNEANRFLAEVLEHLRNHVTNEIVFTDDCSDDDTLAIATGYGCHTYQMDKPTFVENEGLLRDMAWKNLENHVEQDSWILCIDADEKLYGYEHLPNYINQNQWDVLGIPFFHMWNPTHYRVDKAWAPTLSARLFRYFPNGTYPHRKLACGAEPNYIHQKISDGRVLWKTPFGFQHLGYVRDEDKLAKYKRYSTIDGGNFHALSHINSILDENPTLLPWGHQ